MRPRRRHSLGAITPQQKADVVAAEGPLCRHRSVAAVFVLARPLHADLLRAHSSALANVWYERWSVATVTGPWNTSDRLR